MAVAPAYPVRSPRWLLMYQGINITTDVSAMVLSIHYTDRLGGRSGDLELLLEDRERKWQGPWSPQPGDTVSLFIGYAEHPLLPCGDFQVDELELEGPPDVLHLRCLPAWITPALRTRNSIGYENQSLLQIATTIAARHGMNLVAAPNQADVSYQRVTQKQETDLEFLLRLARAHNYDFTVRGSQLVFFERSYLESMPATMTLYRRDVEHFRLIRKTHGIYKQSRVAYFDPFHKQLLTQAVDATPAVATGDILKTSARCENDQQAMERAAAELHEMNRLNLTGHLVTPGTPLLVAGINVALSGWGSADGTYIIDRARHQLSRATGYITDLAARKVA